MRTTMTTSCLMYLLCVASTLHILILGDDHKDLLVLERKMFNWRLDDRPEFASYIGHYRNSDRLEHYGLDYMTLRYETASNFLGTLRSINSSRLSSRDQVDYAILLDMLQTFVDGYQWRNWNYLTPMTWLEGHQRDPYFFVDSTPFDNRGDFENYIARLNEMPRLFKEYNDLFKEAIRLNRTVHHVSVSRVPEQIDFILHESVDNSTYLLPFIEHLGYVTLSPDARADIILRAKMATTELFKAYKRLNTFIKNEYLRHTRIGVGVGSLVGGKDYYKACLKWFLSLDITPEEIHQIGKNEIARVQKEMKKIMRRQGYGHFKITEYFRDLESRKEMFFDTEEQIIKEYEIMIAERIEPHLSSLFHDPPGLPIKVDVMRSDGSRAEYMAGTPDGLRPGIFFINTFRKWPKYSMISIAMHEANPGHHLQMSYAASADLQEFRKMKEFSDIYRVPFAFPSYTAYMEGWALYSESLGIETGIYKDDYERMGYYDAEMYRACRMVADTGMHYFGWTRDEAINLFLEHTSETREGIEVEVDRYITWPGQAVTYKIGELKIQELKKYAKDQLGDDFDIRDFHRVVLENGGMPLNLLSKLVKDWVVKFQRERNNIDESIDEDCACSSSMSSESSPSSSSTSSSSSSSSSDAPKRKSRCQRSLHNKNTRQQEKQSQAYNNKSWRNAPSGLWVVFYVIVSCCVISRLDLFARNSLFL